MSVKIKDKNNFDIKLLLEEIDYDCLYGRGGSFLVTPLEKAKIFSKEMFTDDQKMFAEASYEYATTKMKPLKEDHIPHVYILYIKMNVH